MTRPAAKALLNATEAMGNCAPKVLGRVGITEGNRQTYSLGMLMSQLTNAVKYRPNYELWKSVARVGEQPDDYIKNELSGDGHVGETPFDLIDEIEALVAVIKENYDIASEHVPNKNDDLSRIFDDLKAVMLLSQHYCEKIKAAMYILKYKYNMDDKCVGDVTLLKEALTPFEKSLLYYRELTELTEKTYLYANSMQTPQRKIPFADGELHGHWAQCLPKYEKEFKNFKENVEKLVSGWSYGDDDEAIETQKLIQTDFEVLSENCEKFTVKIGQSLFTDSKSYIQTVAGELDGMTGVRFGMGEAIVSGVTVKLKLEQDSKILIGYFNDKGVEWLAVPELETNTHADDRGGLAVVYAHALKAQGCSSVNVHAFRYEKGEHEIYFGTGCFCILGVVSQEVEIIPRNAGLVGEGPQTLDWLYENE